MSTLENQPAPGHCPRCGNPLTPEGPAGLCSRCLLAAAADTADVTRNTADTPSLAAVAAAFPHFEILEFLGRGGMGCVYRARQAHLDRTVALKLLPQALATDPSFVERFTREARVLAKLSHPNIVTVYDFGQSGGFCWLLMEYVEGANLRQALRTGGFTAEQALAIVPRICEALQYAHGEGVLHRDIKPENILLDTRGRVKLVDFGIAKMVGDVRSDFTLTATGAPLGTPHYMAPEQVESPSGVDHRADIFSLGVVFYEMLTGGLPLGRFPAPSTKTPVDTRIDAVVFRTLEKERENRQQSADEVRTQVEGIASTPGLAPRSAGTSATPAPAPAHNSVPPGGGTRRPSLWDWAEPAAGILGLWSTLALLAGWGGTFRGELHGNRFFTLLAATSWTGVPALVLGALAYGRASHSSAAGLARWVRIAVLAWPAGMVIALLGAITRLGLGTILLLFLLGSWIWFGRKYIDRRTLLPSIRQRLTWRRVLGGILGAIALLVFVIVMEHKRWESPSPAFQVEYSPSSVPTNPTDAAGPPTLPPNPSDGAALPTLSGAPESGQARSHLDLRTADGLPIEAVLRFQSNGVPVDPPLWRGLLGTEQTRFLHIEVEVAPGPAPGANRVRFFLGAGGPEQHQSWIQLPQGVQLLSVPHTAFILPAGAATNVWMFQSADSLPLWGLAVEIASTHHSPVPAAPVTPVTSLPATGGTVLIHGAIQQTVMLTPGRTNFLTDTLLGLDLSAKPNVSLDKVILRRADGTQSTNDVRAWINENKRGADIPLRDGDWIEIRERKVIF